MIKILITGDYCPINRIEELSLNNKHEQIFNDFLPKIKEVDIAITNLECPLIDEDYISEKFGPSLKASTKTIETLKFAGFDVVTLSNNHIMDHGEAGLKSTLECLKINGIDFVGVGNDLERARKPLIKNIKNKKIAFFNFAENEFSNTHGDYPGSNPLSLVSNFNDIRNYKNLVDKIIVIFHGGNEMYQLPSPRLKETFRFFVDSGADAVISHHTHCFSGYEIYNNAPIFYSLGNFIFDYNLSKNELWNIGMGVVLKIENSKINFEIIPFSQNKNDNIGLMLLNEKEKNKFNNKIIELNSIIADDKKLNTEFQKFIESKEQQYSHYLEPYSNKILHGLFGRKIIPSFYSKKKKQLLLNLIRCESHRDIILKLLSK